MTHHSVIDAGAKSRLGICSWGAYGTLRPDIGLNYVPLWRWHWETVMRWMTGCWGFVMMLVSKTNIMNGHCTKCFKHMNALGIFYTPRSVPSWFSFLFILFINLFNVNIIIHLVHICLYMKRRFSPISVFSVSNYIPQKYSVSILKVKIFCWVEIIFCIYL